MFLNLYIHHIQLVLNNEFVHTIGDAHIYKDHFDVVKEQISRTPYPKCQLVLNPEVKSFFDFSNKFF